MLTIPLRSRSQTRGHLRMPAAGVAYSQVIPLRHKHSRYFATTMRKTLSASQSLAH